MAFEAPFYSYNLLTRSIPFSLDQESAQGSHALCAPSVCFFFFFFFCAVVGVVCGFGGLSPFWSVAAMPICSEPLDILNITAVILIRHLPPLSQSVTILTFFDFFSQRPRGLSFFNRRPEVPIPSLPFDNVFEGNVGVFHSP